MSYVVRAVDNISKWDLGTDYHPLKLINADPIGHLKTNENELSVFVVDDINKIDHIAIAIASTRPDFRRFHCVFAERKELKNNKIRMKHDPTTGRTPVDKANQQHWNLIKLKARDLEKLAKIFLYNVNKKSNFKTYSQQTVKAMVKAVIDDDKYIKKQKVHPNLIEELQVNPQK